MVTNSSAKSVRKPVTGRQRRRIVVIGSGGRLGRQLLGCLAADHAVIGFDHRQLDLASPAAIDAALGGLVYDRLYLTAALTAVDYCETHAAEAMAVNAAGPARVAQLAAEQGAHVTYISTDMVFDGEHDEPYVEDDRPAPISVYGESKLAGEQAVLAASPANLVVRISWLFGPGKPAFPEWIINRACREERLVLPGDKIACPTYSMDLVRWLLALGFGDGVAPAGGIVHLCNAEPCSWLAWGQGCVEAARDAGWPVVAGELAAVPMATIPAFVAKRPRYSALSTAKFEAMTGIEPRPWRAAVEEFLHKMLESAQMLERAGKA